MNDTTNKTPEIGIDEGIAYAERLRQARSLRRCSRTETSVFEQQVTRANCLQDHGRPESVVIGEH